MTAIHAKITSRLIIGVSCTPETEGEIRKVKDHPGPIGFTVYETFIDGKIVYTCTSGGDIIDGQPAFTLIGLGAFEALANLKLGAPDAQIRIQQCKLGKTPMAEKITEALLQTPPGHKVCFIGDMSNELDGVVTMILNPQGVLELCTEIDQ